MENNVIKILTWAIIAAGIYVFLKGRNASIVSGTQAVVDTGKCNLKAQSMESSTCAIPLASDYLMCNPAHVAAASATVKPAAPAIIPMLQTKNCLVPAGTSASYGTGISCSPPAPLKVTGLCCKKIPFTVSLCRGI